MPYELIFSCRLAPHVQAGEVAAIVQDSRVRNRRVGITGLMAFDGRQVCQLLEGDVAAVDRLTRTISRDPRHEHFSVLHAGAQEGSRRFPDWPMALALYDADSLSGIIKTHIGMRLGDRLQATDPLRIDGGS